MSPKQLKLNSQTQHNQSNKYQKHKENPKATRTQEGQTAAAVMVHHSDGHRTVGGPSAASPHSPLLSYAATGKGEVQIFYDRVMAWHFFYAEDDGLHSVAVSSEDVTSPRG